jgi:hypothetical protein
MPDLPGSSNLDQCAPSLRSYCRAALYIAAAIITLNLQSTPRRRDAIQATSGYQSALQCGITLKAPDLTCDHL